MNFKKLILTLASGACIALFSASAASAQTGTVTADVLKVRSSTGTSTPVITRVTYGTELELLTFDGAWYKVRLSDGLIGYVSAEYITPGVAYFGSVTATNLMMRTSASTDASVIRTLPNDTLVELLGYNGSWYNVRVHDGTDGYVSADYISTTATLPITEFSYSAAAVNSDVYYGYVNSDMVRIHASTGDYSTVLALLQKKEKLQLLAYDGSWYRVVNSAGIEGFVKASHIVLSESSVPTGYATNTIPGYIDATALNIRTEGNTEAKVISSLPMGASVNLAGYDGSWYTVILSDGRVGYASGEYVSLNPVSATVLASPETPKDMTVRVAPTESTYILGQQIIATAQQYLGKPYVWAADGPDSFDCSGFTMYVMNLHGIKLPHQSGMQYTYGFSVSKNELIAGDLVFFNSNKTSGVAHVGIYIGEGKFIHASSGSAHAVTISALSQDYYTAHYLGARRVI